MNDDADTEETVAPPRDARRAARLAAVQALYQIEMNDAGADEVIAEFVRHRLGADDDGSASAAADPELFADLVRGACARGDEIDALISRALSANWTIDRLELLLRAVLRVGVYELVGRPQVPVRVAINEHIEIAHDFFSRGEPGMVNGVLDRIARDVRAAEFADADDTDDTG